LDYEKLKRQNAADTAALNQPYQPVVYAIPQEHWIVMMRLMKQLPEILSATEQCRNQIREMSSQAGRTQEQSSQRLKELEDLLYRQAQQNQSALLKKLAFWLGAGVMFLAALLASLLIFHR